LVSYFNRTVSLLYILTPTQKAAPVEAINRQTYSSLCLAILLAVGHARLWF